MPTHRSSVLPVLTLLAAASLTACGDSTGVDGPGSVALNFRVAPTSSSFAAAVLEGAPAAVPARATDVSGSNGTLTIDEVWLIVAEAELDGDDDWCEDSDGEDSGSSGSSSASSDCAEFEAPPRFLELPLDGSPVLAFQGLVPPGTYTELEFEIEDLDDDEDDEEFAAEIAALRDVVLDRFPDWPRNASARVQGSFQPTDDQGIPTGDPVDFTVYLEAEIEVERTLSPPLVVADDGTGASDLTVDVQLEVWFSRSDGSVIDLSLYDYESTGLILEIEVEMEDGFTEIEFDD